MTGEKRTMNLTKMQLKEIIEKELKNLFSESGTVLREDIGLNISQAIKNLLGDKESKEFVSPEVPAKEAPAQSFKPGFRLGGKGGPVFQSPSEEETSAGVVGSLGAGALTGAAAGAKGMTVADASRVVKDISSAVQSADAVPFTKLGSKEAAKVYYKTLKAFKGPIARRALTTLASAGALGAFALEFPGLPIELALLSAANLASDYERRASAGQVKVPFALRDDPKYNIETMFPSGKTRSSKKGARLYGGKRGFLGKWNPWGYGGKPAAERGWDTAKRYSGEEVEVTPGRPAVRARYESIERSLQEIIEEELKKVLEERGFGEGEPSKDELSKKREVHLEEVKTDDYSVEKLSNGLIRIRKMDSGLVGLYNSDGSYKSGDLKLSKDEVKKLANLGERELEEAYSEKQRKWACAQAGKSRKKFKGKLSLSSKEAKEMCKDTELKKAKKKK